MRSPSYGELASWPESDYQNPETRGPAVLIVQLVLLPIAILTVSARTYVRSRILKKTWADDWLMVIATTLSAGLTIDVILATQKFGWNIHIWDLTVDCGQLGRKASIAAQTLYLLASTMIKASILVQYLRLVPIECWFRRFTWLCLAFVALTALTFLVVVWVQCIPIENYWLLADERHCLDEEAPAMAQAVASVVADALIYILPIPTFASLQLSRKQRIGLIAVFAIGLLVVIAGSLRTYYTIEALRSYDVTWKGFPMWLCTAVEVNLGVICACVPTLRPLFKGFKDKRSIGEVNLTGSPMAESPMVESERRRFSWRKPSSLRPGQEVVA